MFRTILIANRGEIALRAIRACKELGLRTVVVHSTADAESLPVRFADEAVCIGPAEPRGSYLNIPAILSAAEITNADAIYPGYGFLAENASFAEVCEACGLTFIGPPAPVIALMGDKIKARETMAAAGVPILPGSFTEVDREEEGRRVARSIGYPVIVKAALGGGGKGMKIAHSPAGLMAALLTAQAEAAQSFGNGAVYVEKFVPKHRHVEFQLVADAHGQIVHLGERDCSIQRRHQKLLEEAPSPGMTPALREAMGEVALRAARTVGFQNLGTVEFLLDPEGHFYFIEMNTRIQVEHPVTEMVTGEDLVKWQILLAAGEPLTFRQEDVRLRGHAIECRIIAEDPETFLPSPGRITAYHAPGGPGIRVDAAIHTQCDVSRHYDSLVAKVIAHAEDRPAAITRMRRALEEYIIDGIRTSIPFDLKVLNDRDFQRGVFDVQFAQRFFTPRADEEAA